MTTTDRSPAPARPAVAPVPLSRLVRVELEKAVASRSGRWLLAALVVVIAAVVAVRLLTADAEDLTFRGFLDVTSAPASLLLPLLAILAVTTEWSKRTVLTTFTLEPSRVRVVLAKLAAVVVVALLAAVAALVAAAVGNVAGSALLGGSGTWTIEPSELAELVVTQLLAVVQGFAFGLLLRSTAAAIVASYLLAPVWSTALSLVGSLEGLAPWLDLSTALVPLSSGSVSGQEWAQLVRAILLWVLLPLGLGVARLLRGEIKPD